MAELYICLHQHHHEHMSNVLYYDLMAAMTSLDDRNISAPLNLMVYVVCGHYVAQINYSAKFIFLL